VAQAADFASESHVQTGLWFYGLHKPKTLVFWGVHKTPCLVVPDILFKTKAVVEDFGSLMTVDMLASCSIRYFGLRAVMRCGVGARKSFERPHGAVSAGSPHPAPKAAFAVITPSRM
jgi:hypothetical protein